MCCPTLFLSTSISLLTEDSHHGLHKFEGRVKKKGHAENVDFVDKLRVMLLQGHHKKLHDIQVDALQTCFSTIEENTYLLSFFLSRQILKKEDEHLLQIFQCKLFALKAAKVKH